MSDVRLCGYVIEVYPLSVLTFDYALCAKDHTVGVILGELLEDLVYLINRKLLGCLAAEACKHLVGVVMMVTLTSAGAMLTVIVVVMLVMMLVVVMMFVIVVMLVLVVIFVVVMIFVIVVMLVVVMMHFLLTYPYLV